MFVGHFAVGFAAKRAAPETSLAVLFVAAQLADLLWPLLVAIGVEQVRIDLGNTAFTPLDFVSYPYSHSLALLILWGVVLGAVAVRRKVDTTSGVILRTFAILALLVVSHWFLDWATHRADMPLYPGSARYGLGLWNSVPATLTIELAMFAIGVSIYAMTTRARDGVGRWGFALFVAFLIVVYVANVYGPPPPSVTAIWVTALIGGAVLIVWSWWIDRHRGPTRVSA
jgi:membrane-bound metal-dependent hydrolase YbcI (DUF457 family)